MTTLYMLFAHTTVGLYTQIDRDPWRNFSMPDLRRLLLTSGAVVLLAAVAGGQQQASPFRQPPRMPPEIMPRSRSVVSPTLELDNQQVRVMRYALDPGDRWIVAANSLLVAVTGLAVESPSGVQQLVAGETRWIADSGTWVHNLSSARCRYLVIQPKHN